MTVERQLPRYKCHKEVWALKIREVIKHAHPDPNADDAAFEASPEFQGAHLFFEDAGYAPIPVDADWYRKHNPSAGGYYVVYQDGYKSFSPADAFEDAVEQQKRAEDAEALLTRARGILDDWVGRQGHDRCWYYPEIFSALIGLLGVKVPDEALIFMPPREEFELGCVRYMDEQYAPRPSSPNG